MWLRAEAVVTGEQVLRPGFILVEDGRIARVASIDPNQGEAGDHLVAITDLGAVTVVPGFVDMHSHGGGGAAFQTGTPQATRQVLELHRRHGTVAMMASLVSEHPQPLLRQVAMLAEQVQDGLLLGIHLEGPWLAPGRKGAHDPTALRGPDPGEVAALLSVGKGAIAMVTIAPELDGAMDTIAHLADAGVLAAVGHTNATYEQALAAIDAGARVATHLFNAMRPVHHREPGPVIALLDDERVTLEMITDGTHLHPALYREVSQSAGPQRIALVTDAMAAAGMSDGAYRLGPLEVEVERGVARIAGTDTIAGSTATMDQLFRFAVRHSGLDGDDALLAAVRQTSMVPARVLGLPADGLSLGAAANLVVLDADLQVLRVMVAGEWFASAS